MNNQNEMRPPYVRFERTSVEDRLSTLENGKYGFKDVDMAYITVPGNKDTVVRVVEDWIKDLTKRAEDGLCPSQWVIHFQTMYDYWKKGEEAPLNGTPIKGWGNLSPAQQKTVIQAGLTTVEDLAAANDAALHAVGMGGLSFKLKAVAWLKAAEGPGKLVEENTKLQMQLDAQAGQIAAQQKQIQELLSRIPEKKAA